MIKTMMASIVVFALGACLAFPAMVSASPTSQKLIEEGVTDLVSRNFQQALEKFDAAVQADPADAKAIFFQGVALNRLARYQEALTRLQNAKAKGSTHQDLDFETGWSLLELERWNEAAGLLERYRQDNPERGKTSEFLGRTYFELGQFGKAEAALKEAIRLDPALKPTATLYLAEIEEQKQKPEEASRLIQRALEESPESPPLLRLREQMARVAAPVAAEKKAYSLAFSAGGGYNSNVIALGKGSTPADISHKGSTFTHYTFDARYDLKLSQADTLTGGYSFLADVYSRVPSFDLRDHYPYLDYRHVFTENLAGVLRVSDEYTEIGDARFLNQGGARPALLYRLTDWALAEVAYTFNINDYYQAAAVPAQIRSGYTQTLAFNNYFKPRHSQFEARLGYFHVWNHARGTDFSYQGNGVVVGFNTPLFWQINSDVSYAWEHDTYRNPNSLSGPPGFGGFLFNRSDNLHIVNVLLSRPIFPWLRFYARYDYTREQSKVDFYSYTQNVTTAGFVVPF